MAEETRWLDDQEQRLWRIIREFLWHFPSAMDRQLMRDSKMQSGEYSVLATLSESSSEQLRPADVARELDWDRSRLSHLLRRMENKGLIERCTDVRDGRGNLISLTEQGWHTIRTAAPSHVNFIREAIFDQLEADEREVIGRALTRILSNLDGQQPGGQPEANC
ncbi:MarR family winged helix-turn-helix transcriptional regulator [Glutamicibacter creatinolyticus]|uniref:MarR family winged helix-turn-helix transcriptional regulator n=1 Tax=Glutamicibacter creatinolyticus TaxID=162496 RepID=UPI0033C34B1F